MTTMILRIPIPIRSWIVHGTRLVTSYGQMAPPLAHRSVGRYGPWPAVEEPGPNIRDAIPPSSFEGHDEFEKRTKFIKSARNGARWVLRGRRGMSDWRSKVLFSHWLTLVLGGETLVERAKIDHHSLMKAVADLFHLVAGRNL